MKKVFEIEYEISGKHNLTEGFVEDSLLETIPFKIHNFKVTELKPTECECEDRFFTTNDGKCGNCGKKQKPIAEYCKKCECNKDIWCKICKPIKPQAETNDKLIGEDISHAEIEEIGEILTVNYLTLKNKLNEVINRCNRVCGGK